MTSINMWFACDSGWNRVLPFTLVMCSLVVPSTASAQDCDKTERPGVVRPVKQRTELEHQAKVLNEKGVQLYRRGRYADATKVFEEALAVQRKLYPPVEFPRGHVRLATSINNLGRLHAVRGSYVKALPYYEQSLAMRRQLYPANEYPTGHPLLASSLNNLGALYRDQGKYPMAALYYEEALKMRQRLYPVDKFPHGHIDLATSLNNMGGLFEAQKEHARGLVLYEQALRMMRQLYPTARFPNGHPHLARSLSNLGSLLAAQGKFSLARKRVEEALNIREKLYDRRQFPKGHPDLALGLNELGFSFFGEGDYEHALPYFEKALEMRIDLFQAVSYPNGHPELAKSLVNVGTVLQTRGELQRALPYFEKALAMQRKLYSLTSYRNGHPDLIDSLNNLGGLRTAQGRYDEARDNFEQALAMSRNLSSSDRNTSTDHQLAVCLNNMGYLHQAQQEYERALPHVREALDIRRKLYPTETYPRGHPQLANSLSNVGVSLLGQGATARAHAYFVQALEMRRKLYHVADYPSGHPKLTQSLDNLGFEMHTKGDYVQAVVQFGKAERMKTVLAESFISSVSEAEALNYCAEHLATPNWLLSSWRHTDLPVDELYSIIWPRRGVIEQIIARRQRVLRASASPEVQQLHQEYLESRRQLSRLLLSPAEVDPDRERQHGELLRRTNQRKERLEHQLADKVPTVLRHTAVDGRTPAHLGRSLPPDTALVDCLLYRLVGRSTNENEIKDHPVPCYAAFILRHGSRVAWVDLGSAELIDKSIDRWREDIHAGRESDSATKLRSLVWEPIEEELGKGIETVYLCPDGRLTAMPWIALPGRSQTSVLLEEYQMAIVPHGTFLLGQLLNKPTRGSGELLAVGDVRYDEQPQRHLPASNQLVERGLMREAVTGNTRIKWPYLSGTSGEIEEVVRLADSVRMQRLAKSKASTQSVIDALPRVRWAHFATHGFFADPKIRSAFQLNEKYFERQLFSLRSERTTIAGRNPLVLSGLVLAGANLPRKKDKWGAPIDDGGILTAEAIAGLPLQNLELAVLSACETGIGEVAGGEGVFGLQRAFHIAGAKNVIASLWKVDDQATAALMRLFYHKLWQEKKPPMEALRQSQLAVYRHPNQISKLATTRGPDFNNTVKLVEGGSKKLNKSDYKRADTRLWAAFVLSGAGR